MKKKDITKLGKILCPDDGDEVFGVIEADQKPHFHKGQTSGEPHNDNYHIKNEGGNIVYDKYHSDDK